MGGQDLIVLDDVAAFEARCGMVWRDSPLMGEIARKITWCDLLIVVGTSSIVQPASGFASQVKEHNGKVAIFDIQPPNKCDDADFLLSGVVMLRCPKYLT